VRSVSGDNKEMKSATNSQIYSLSKQTSKKNCVINVILVWFFLVEKEKFFHQSKIKTRSRNLGCCKLMTFPKDVFQNWICYKHRSRQKKIKFVLKQFAFILFDTSEVFQISEKHEENVEWKKEKKTKISR
jgi:hypothetical protein